ncbi:LysE/ArgO family amino acid transporter [Nocardioides sp. C4-1]|uniref:LysE/ArgO family amino acid transporter n=1 Tax=Nocardioides sp. C4-1 TaxID=3151851 RepID=UPI00326355E8
MLTSSVAGLLTGLSLIVAIGAQNAFVLRQGLARRHVAPVVAVCAISDLVLILAGVAGIGTVVERAGWLIDVVRWAGVAFLTWYGVTALLRARRAESLEAATGGDATLGRAVRTAVALTWLNPHVYLDTVLLLGSIANTHDHRWWFGAGAAVASLLWFTGLGYGARRAHRLLSTPRAWQVLDVLIGLTMLAIAASLALGG